jgi:hypothetical protein
MKIISIVITVSMLTASCKSRRDAQTSDVKTTTSQEVLPLGLVRETYKLGDCKIAVSATGRTDTTVSSIRIDQPPSSRSKGGFFAIEIDSQKNIWSGMCLGLGKSNETAGEVALVQDKDGSENYSYECGGKFSAVYSFVKLSVRDGRITNLSHRKDIAIASLPSGKHSGPIKSTPDQVICP